MLNRGTLERMIDDAGLSDHKPAIIASARPSIHLTLKPVLIEDAMPAGISKIGGLPDLPRPFNWPHIDDQPMAFIAQLQMADLAPYDVEHRLPGTGLLYFFYGAGVGRVFFGSVDAMIARRGFPPALNPANRFAACHVYYHSEWTLPPPPLNALGGDGSARYISLRARMRMAAGAHRVLGYPDSDYFADSWPWLLLQVDTNPQAHMHWPGRLSYTLSEDALTARRFDEAACSFQQV